MTESLKGIDVSYAQGQIDWAKVKPQIDFAIIRSSLGWTDGDISLRRDIRFLDNVSGCTKNNIPYGIYHYSYCLNPANAKKEAEYFLRVIKGTKPTMGVWFDIEDNKQIPLGKNALTQITKDFCDTVRAAGYDVGIYSYKSFLENYLDLSRLDYPVWLAQVGVSAPTYKGPFEMWQYSWTGSIDGISGDVDLDLKEVEAEENEVLKLIEEIEERLYRLRKLI
jgi:GH25 family lysozyme M1 (1,4-beta-N-acetylmuramidase)